MGISNTAAAPTAAKCSCSDSLFVLVGETQVLSSLWAPGTACRCLHPGYPPPKNHSTTPSLLLLPAALLLAAVSLWKWSLEYACVSQVHTGRRDVCRSLKNIQSQSEQTGTAQRWAVKLMLGLILAVASVLPCWWGSGTSRAGKCAYGPGLTPAQAPGPGAGRMLYQPATAETQGCPAGARPFAKLS